MKYFKPELLARVRSSDDNVAEAAAKEWDEATVAYRTRLRAIRDNLPRGVRLLGSNVSLHDAKFLGVAIDKKRPFFGIMIQLEGSSEQTGEVLELNYHVVAGPNGGVRIRMNPSSGENVRKAVRILYDEFDLDEEHSFFTHTLLPSDGREIEVRFHNLSTRRLGNVFTPTELTERNVTWPLVESMA